MLLQMSLIVPNKSLINILMVCQLFERPEDNGSDRIIIFVNIK